MPSLLRKHPLACAPFHSSTFFSRHPVSNLVENNAGVSFVLGDGYRPLVHIEDTTAIPLDPPILYETGFVWKKGKRISRAARRCITYVQRQIKEIENS